MDGFWTSSIRAHRNEVLDIKLQGMESKDLLILNLPFSVLPKILFNFSIQHVCKSSPKPHVVDN